jgi:hypothetical protein
MKNLFKKLAAFQHEVPAVHKATQGFGYTYADLPKILEVITPIMNKHGLGFTQLINDHTLHTIVFDAESGESIESKTQMPQITLKGMNEYQSFGSGITYYRRYALSAMLGIVTDKDTDASGEQVKKELPALSEERLNKAIEAIKAGQTTMADISKRFKLTPVQITKIEESC